MRKISLLLLFFVWCVVAYSQSKMSTNTSLLLMSMKKDELSGVKSAGLNKSFVIRNRGNEKCVNAFIHLSGADELYHELESLGVKINSRFPGIVTASIPIDKLEQIAALKDVKYVEIGTPVHDLMDNARTAIKVDDVQSGFDLPHPFLGTGIIVGLVDIGFEYGHLNFYNYNQTELRIKRVWNQNDLTGTAPHGFNYGTELKTTDEILNAKYDSDVNLHGTHVAGIAAGADTIDNRFYGIAGDADITMVSMDAEYDAPDNTVICDGVKYLFDYATSENKPCVINLSLGCGMGPHDGTSTFDILADAMQGKGRIIVGAVGNEGNKSRHISKTFTSGTKDSLSSFINLNPEHKGFIDIWGDKSMRYTVQLHVYDSSKKQIKRYLDVIDASFEEGNERVYTFNDARKEGFAGQVSIVSEISPLNGKPHVSILTDFATLVNGNYIGFTIRPLTSGTVHAWADMCTGATLDDLHKDGYTAGNGESSCNEIGGSGKRIISVGAYISKNRYKDIDGTVHQGGGNLYTIAPFSSLGPTFDGRIKPDVTAPGSQVISSVSSYYSNFEFTNIVNRKTWNGQTYSYSSMQGTSMASPCVAGIVATWLQANNDLTPEDIKSILKRTSIQDSFTGDLSEQGDNTWGYGKINAWEGIKESLRMNASGIAPETFEPVVLIPAGSNGFKLLFAHSSNYTNIAVFDVNGRKICAQQISNISAGDEVPVLIDGFTLGFYIVKVISDQVLFIKKVFLN